MKALYAAPLLAPILALALAACSPAKAPVPPTYDVAGVKVAGPYSRPAAQGGNGAGFFSLTNGNTGPDILFSVESPIADHVEIHESSVEGGMMKMQHLERGVPLRAGETVEFKPGGKHLMFIGLKQALKPGDKIPATFVLEHAGRVPVELTVQGGAPKGAGMDHSAH
ncbi:copper chaperone PCu(A)C [Caulobacter mirabilis]|uniref:Copper chaperone PCu(A)C n=1 Tax=Caulobacter mirabilis TaxID=69666 RepID=A0A2D2ATH2_9CAUL|nr:copper chaperone PCu(A)C [Caulobacter mirabilis]ATQ41267.1 hypothetical protein CSW64_02000 [Caulobacter mirabilis]